MGTMVRILHKTRMSMQTDHEFLMWWQKAGNNATVLATLSEKWLPPPEEVISCVDDLITNVLSLKSDDLAESVVEDILHTLSQRFVEEGLDYMIRLRETENCLGKGASKSDNVVSQSTFVSV